MGLRDRLESQRSDMTQRAEAEKAALREQELTGLRSRIQNLQSERERLSSAGSELNRTFEEYTRAHADARTMRDALEHTMDEYRDVLESNGIHNVRDLLASPDYKADEEVLGYSQQYATTVERKRAVGSSRKAAQEALGDRSVQRPGSQEGSDTVMSRERLTSAIQERVQELDREIAELEMQTPEGMEERKRQARIRVDQRSRPADLQHDSSIVKDGDLDEAGEFGAEVMKGAIVAHYEDAIDRSVQAKQEKDGVFKAQEDLERIDKNVEFEQEARKEFAALTVAFSRAKSRIASFLPEDRDRSALERAESAVQRWVEKLDASLKIEQKQDSVPRPYAKYVKNGGYADWPGGPIGGVRSSQIDQHHLSQRTVLKVENFQATLEQIRHIRGVLDELATITPEDFNMRDRKAMIVREVTHPRSIELSPETSQVLEHLYGSVDKLRAQLEERVRVDQERAEEQKKLIPDRVERDWADTEYGRFRTGEGVDKVIREDRERQKMRPDAEKILTEIARLRIDLAPNLATEASTQDARWGGGDVMVEFPKIREEIERLKERIGQLDREYYQLQSELRTARQGLLDAEGWRKRDERKRLNTRITELEGVSSTEVGLLQQNREERARLDQQRSELGGQWQKAQQELGEFATLLRRHREVIVRVEEGRSAGDKRTLDDILTHYEELYGDVVEPQLSEPEQEILRRETELRGNLSPDSRWMRR